MWLDQVLEINSSLQVVGLASASLKCHVLQIFTPFSIFLSLKQKKTQTKSNKTHKNPPQN